MVTAPHFQAQHLSRGRVYPANQLIDMILNNKKEFSRQPVDTSQIISIGSAPVELISSVEDSSEIKI